MAQAVKTETPVEPFAGEPIRSGPTFSPRVDLVENENELLLFADLPGVQPEDLDIRCEQGELVIFGKVTPRQEDKVEYLVSEYGVGDFHRSFRLGQLVDPSLISAELKNGVLTLHLPKSEKLKPRRIDVKAV